MHTIAPNEKEWISVLTIINANVESILNYYSFKGVRSTRDCLALCKHRATFGINDGLFAQGHGG